MKRFGMSMFLFLISVCVFSSCTNSISSNNQANTRGNTVGNILNYGFVAQEGDWFFFNTSKNEEGSLWKKNIKTKKESVKISDEPGLFLNVVDGWIFYNNESDAWKLYKIRTDGTERTLLSDDDSQSINVVGDWIYYGCESDDGYYIYKIRTDGTERQLVK